MDTGTPTFDYKILGSKLGIGLIVIALTIAAGAFGVVPAFPTWQAFATFAGSILGTCAGIDALTFSQAKQQAQPDKPDDAG